MALTGEAGGWQMTNKKAFVGGLVFTLLGATLLLYVMHDESWMTLSTPLESTPEVESLGIDYRNAGSGIKFGLYQIEVSAWGEVCRDSECQDLSNNREVVEYTTLTEVCGENGDPSDFEEAMCEITKVTEAGEAGDLGHWLFISAICLSFIALILAAVGIPGYMHGWVPLLLNAISTLVIVAGAVVWLVAFPDLNTASGIGEGDERFSPSYGFYLSIVSAPFIFIGGIVWGGIDGFNLEGGEDDWDDEDEDWQDAVMNSKEESSDWRRQGVPVSYGTEAHHQYQQNMMQQYEYQDQSYHHRQSYGSQPNWQRSAPRPAPRSAPLSGPPQSGPPQSGPPQSGPPQTGPPQSGPPQSGPPQTGPPQSGPPQSGPPQSGPPSSGPPQSGPPQSGPPGSQAGQRVGPPGSTYGQQRAPKVRKAATPALVQETPAPSPAQPSAPASPPSPTVAPAAPAAPPSAPPAPSTPYAAPVPAAPPTTVTPAETPVATPTPPVTPVAPPQPVAPVAPAQGQLQQYIAPHQMPVAQSSFPPSDVSGTVRPDGWEILEWPSGSGKWFWKNQNTGQWSVWT